MEVTSSIKLCFLLYSQPIGFGFIFILLETQIPPQSNSEEIHYVLIKQVQFFLFFTLLIPTFQS